MPRPVTIAVHVSDIGLRSAPDETVLATPDADSRILITADTDLGTLLALSGAARPSVILLRRPGRRSTERAQIVLTILDVVSEALHRGAVITVETTRIACENCRSSRDGEDDPACRNTCWVITITVEGQQVILTELAVPPRGRP